jgi:murein DD-endopeptidase MepM/ murein hydrolase activator NlpD
MLIKIFSACIAVAALCASPAQAQESAIGVASTARAADSTAAVDAEFRELFGSWSNLETGGSVTVTGDILAAPRAGVSVPSRMPIDAVALTSGFGMRTHPVLGGRRQHQGVDLAAPRGTPVYATADGLVGMAQWYSSYGNYVQIEHGGELQTRYAHLTSYTVAPGDMVEKGDLIGYVGSTGRSTGPHLHYEVRVAGVAVDPRPYMVANFANAEDDAQAARGGPE